MCMKKTCLEHMLPSSLSKHIIYRLTSAYANSVINLSFSIPVTTIHRAETYGKVKKYQCKPIAESLVVTGQFRKTFIASVN